MATAAAACLLVLFVPAYRAIAVERPDVLLIAVDDLRPMLGCYGDSRMKTPNPPNREEAIAWNGFEMRSYLGVPNFGPIDRSLQLEARLREAFGASVTGNAHDWRGK